MLENSLAEEQVRLSDKDQQTEECVREAELKTASDVGQPGSTRTCFPVQTELPLCTLGCGQEAGCPSAGTDLGIFL